MSANKNDPKDAVKMTSGLDSQTQADLDALMRKYDRESNTRVWEGWLQDFPDTPSNPMYVPPVI